MPADLAAAAARLELPAMAVCDRDGFYGTPRFYHAANDVGVRPLVGTEITLRDGTALPLLAANRTGYQNLCQLISHAKQEPRFPLHSTVVGHKARPTSNSQCGSGFPVLSPICPPPTPSSPLLLVLVHLPLRPLLTKHKDKEKRLKKVDHSAVSRMRTRTSKRADFQAHLSSFAFLPLPRTPRQ